MPSFSLGIAKLPSSAFKNTRLAPYIGFETPHIIRYEEKMAWEKDVVYRKSGVESMHHMQFVDRVKEVAALRTREEAIRITEATLETLGERIERTKTDQVAAQLPNELKAYLLKREHDYNFLLEEFYNRVSRRTRIGYPQAVRQSRSVMAVLQEAVSGSNVKDVFSDLPGNYGELLGNEPKDPLSPTMEKEEGR
jgi:uncharacterized protein (DUF2267 family)